VSFLQVKECKGSLNWNPNPYKSIGMLMVHS